MIRLILNADDFGYSHGVNYGILDSHLYGIVNSATMMMNMPGTEHALEIARNTPSLQIGIHLVLTCGKPLLQDVPSLTDKLGNFKKLGDLNSKEISLSELEREWTAQIERFIESGLTPNHLDSHHHVHTIEDFLPVIQKLADKYQLPVRLNGNKPIGECRGYSDLFLFDFYGPGVTEEYFEKLGEKGLDGKIVEVMCHPAYLDHQLIAGSSYSQERLKELQILTNTKLPETIELWKARV